MGGDSLQAVQSSARSADEPDAVIGERRAGDLHAERVEAVEVHHESSVLMVDVDVGRGDVGRHRVDE